MDFLSKKRKSSGDLEISNKEEASSAELYNLFFTLHKIFCTLCKKDITNNVIFFCPGCAKFFCINCQIEQAQTQNYHDKSHTTFHLISKMNLPLFTSGWTLKEECKLLALIEKQGLDNWEDIADLIKTKDKFQCEAHYYSFYYQKSTLSLPSQGDIILESRPFHEGYFINSEKAKSNEEREKKKLHQVLSNVGKIPEATPKTKNSKTVRNVKKGSTGDGYNIQGYWPKREDFDVEYLNEAENDIMELEFGDEDTEEDRALKYKMLQLYNEELNEREKRKRFVIERNLIDVRRQSEYERKLQKEEKEIYNCIKPFAQYLNPQEFNEFFDGLIIEKSLRQRINQLKTYKALGCTTYEDVLRRTENDAKMKHKKQYYKDNNINLMIAETCGIGNNIKNYLISSQTDISENSAEGERNFVERIGISKQQYNNIKKQIAATVIEERNLGSPTNFESLRSSNGIKCLDDIVDYVVDYHFTTTNEKKK